MRPKHFPSGCTFVFILVLIGCLSAAKRSVAQEAGIEKDLVARLSGANNELVSGAHIDLTYVPDNAQAFSIRNVITLSLNEEAAAYIPEDFTATVTVQVDYGLNASSTSSFTRDLAISYKKGGGIKYDPRSYISFNGAQYVKVTVTLPSIPNLSNGLNPKTLLLLQNEMRTKRYYNLDPSQSLQPLNFASQPLPDTPIPDALPISWQWPDYAGNNKTQLEWTWLEDELAVNYKKTDNSIDLDLLFANNASRVDFPVDVMNYSIPLFYDGQGTLYYRIRAVNTRPSGSTSEGPWSTVQAFAFSGHNNDLNWQVSTSFAEDGKRKSVIQYYDGSLRMRQVVTKDNTTNTAVTSETFYDGAGRPAVQILPAPGINNIVAYTKNLNLFNQQAANDDPAQSFDIFVPGTGGATPGLQNTSGSSLYYSPLNPELASNVPSQNLPDAQGYPYAVTRYTPDATGRIMSQSGVGKDMDLGTGHETKYYYGGAAPEELDGLFGTDAGDYSHYFKSMVRDANGQMSVSYTDMHGRTIATALAGGSPTGMDGLVPDETNYPGQAGTQITRNLLSKYTNVVRNNTSIESLNTILVPSLAPYSFRYALSPEALQLPQCPPASQPVCYDCMYDLEISITDESGEMEPIVRKFSNVKLSADNDCNSPVIPFAKDPATTAASDLSGNVISFTEPLSPGSYAIRKTLTISQASLEKFREQYLAVGLCVNLDDLIQNIYTSLLTTSDCNKPPASPPCVACQAALGTDFNSWKPGYIQNMGTNIPTDEELHAIYAEEQARCQSLCSNVSHRLSAIRSEMLSDMMPYTGQYAKDPSVQVPIPGSRYDIFSTTNSATQPFYKKPQKSDGSPGYYLDANGKVDVSIHSNPLDLNQKLNAISGADFAGLFTPSWAEELLPHHPEYPRLLFAQQILTPSYDWIDNLNQVTTYADATTGIYAGAGGHYENIDPFFAIAASSSKTAISNQATTGIYMNGLSMWQVAAGSAVCKTITDLQQRDDCYTALPLQPPFSGFTTSQLNDTWNAFKTFYTTARETLVNKHIQDNRPLADADPLVQAHYILRFPTTSSQVNTQFGFTGMPTTDGGAPTVDINAMTAASRTTTCSSYIDAWKDELSKCSQLMSRSDAQQILTEITTAMELVCEKGLDQGNPQGSSSVASGTPDYYDAYIAVRNGNWHAADPSQSVWNAKGEPPALCTNCVIVINSGVTVALNKSVTLLGLSKFIVGTDPALGPARLTIAASGAANFANAYNIIIANTGNNGTTNIWGLHGSTDLIDANATSAAISTSYDGIFTSYQAGTGWPYFKRVGKGPWGYVGDAVTSQGNNSPPTRTGPYTSDALANETATAPGGGSPRSFEDVVSNVFTAHGITKDQYCNPFVIEFPKPYGKGPVFTKQAISVIEQCNCDRFATIKQEAATAGYNPANLVSLNQYLDSKYHETLTQTLFDGLQKCNVMGTTTCHQLKHYYNCDSTSPCQAARAAAVGEGSTPNLSLPAPGETCFCTYTTCEIISSIALASAQPRPAFLDCGFTGGSVCATCADLSVLTANFKSYYSGKAYADAPLFNNDNLSPDQISYNIAYEQYLNYHTGFSYNWMEYGRAAATTGCDLASYLTNTSTQPVICPNPHPLNDPTGFFYTPDPCQSVYNMAVTIATRQYEIQKAKLLADFEANYRAKCLGAKDHEQFSVQYLNSEYHYTLYYYDMAGNLVRTLSPRAVRPNFSSAFVADVEMAKGMGSVLQPGHINELASDYQFNSLNEVVTQHTPDAGTSSFWYDILGRLVVSQNSQQSSDNKYSYTLYDPLGRITEVGQKPQTSPMSQSVSQVPGSLDAWINTSGGTREQITGTVYDLPAPWFLPVAGQPSLITQQNLRNRVSYSFTKNLATDANLYAASFYTYDVHGNVDTLLQDYLGSGVFGTLAPYKMICYNYDLVSGKVNGVDYQPGAADAFYHRYRYDAENRLTNVLTSRDSIVWEQDATYKYYKHGPLARTELGHLRAQGLDYSYTLQGWLKGINIGTSGGGTTGGDNSGSSCPTGTALDDAFVSTRSSSSPPAQYTARNSITFIPEFESGPTDEFETLINNSLTACTIGGGSGSGSGLPGFGETYPVALDAYNFSLHYYPGDYKPIGSITANLGILEAIPTQAAPLFNGNIAAMAVNIPKLTNGAKVYNYHYDQLNRLKRMDAFSGLDVTAQTFVPVQLNDYKESVSYDPNGNILAYNRNGLQDGTHPTPAMDNLTYGYYPNTNRLQHIADLPANTGNYAEDIDDQPVANNYTYDAIGNLKTDAASGLTNIDWTVYGKIASITKSSGTIAYTYDASGNRITKTAGNVMTVYVRDAQGNVMSVYQKTGSAAPQQTETHLYGSSRIGLLGALTTATIPVSLSGSFGVATISTYTRGEKRYELSNHLGNVLATITDKKIAVPSSSNSSLIDHYEADVANAQDYYPFGMQMPGRSFTGTNAGTYRYGFNGKENDNEVKKDANGNDLVGGQIDYGMRTYDPRIGKFLSVDPLIQKVPYYTPYQYAGNSPITNVDLDGLEEVHYLFIWVKAKDGKEAALKLAGETIGTPTGEIDKNGYMVYDKPYKIYAHYPAQAFGQTYLVTATYNSEQDFRNAKASDFYKDAILVGANKGAEIANNFGDLLALGYLTSSLSFLTKESISLFVKQRLATYSANLVNKQAIQDLVNRNIREQILNSALSAETKLTTIEAGTQNAHFLSRHGAQTTLQEQLTRATTGLTPDGVAGRAVASSRFLTHEFELEALEKAEAAYNPSLAGKGTVLDMGKTIGNGYLKGGGTLRTANTVQVYYNNSGEVITIFPIIKR